MKTTRCGFGVRSGGPSEKAKTGAHPAMQLKFTVEPVPKASANKSLNKLLSWPQWKEIRSKEYAKYDYHCGIRRTKPSGEKGNCRLECHEVWEYNDTSHIQTLSGLIALCSRCHSVKNWGWARKPAGTVRSFAAWKDEEQYAAYRDGNLKIGGVLLEDHFMTVNRCGLETMREHVVRAAEEWDRRSRHGWQINFGAYARLVS